MKNDSDGNRTRVTAVKGRCLNRLTTEPSTIIILYLKQKYDTFYKNVIF